MLNNLGFQEGPTSITATGGTARNLVSLGDNADSHILYFGTGGYLARTLVEFSKSTPQPSSTSPDGYTQARRSVVMKVPLTLANGLTTICTFRGQLSVSVESTDAEINAMIRNVAQFLGDSEAAGFWTAGQMG